MAEEQEAGAAEVKAPRKKPSLDLVLVGVNVLATLVALGAAVYTKLLYKKTKITEASEIAKKTTEAAAPSTPDVRSIVTLDQISVNVATTSGKSHFATVTMAIECKNERAAGIVRYKKSMFMDQLVGLLAKKQVTELNTIQGRMILKSEILKGASEIAEAGAITDIFFSEFILQ